MEFKNEHGKTLVNTMSFTDAERADFAQTPQQMGAGWWELSRNV